MLWIRDIMSKKNYIKNQLVAQPARYLYYQTDETTFTKGFEKRITTQPFAAFGDESNLQNFDNASRLPRGTPRH